MERQSVIGESLRLKFDGEWEYFHDVLSELVYVKGVEPRSFTKEECRKAFDLLPFKIQMDCLRWGMADTAVRDAQYNYLRDINWSPQP